MATITRTQYDALRLIASGEGYTFSVPMRTSDALKKRELIGSCVSVNFFAAHRITEAGIEAMFAYASANNLRAIERANIPVWVVAK